MVFISEKLTLKQSYDYINKMFDSWWINNDVSIDDLLAYCPNINTFTTDEILFLMIWLYYNFPIDWMVKHSQAPVKEKRTTRKVNLLKVLCFMRKAGLDEEEVGRALRHLLKSQVIFKDSAVVIKELLDWKGGIIRMPTPKVKGEKMMQTTEVKYLTLVNEREIAKNMFGNEKALVNVLKTKIFEDEQQAAKKIDQINQDLKLQLKTNKTIIDRKAQLRQQWEIEVGNEKPVYQQLRLKRGEEPEPRMKSARSVSHVRIPIPKTTGREFRPYNPSKLLYDSKGDSEPSMTSARSERAPLKKTRPVERPNIQKVAQSKAKEVAQSKAKEVDDEKTLLKKIYKKFKANDMQQGIFNQYIEYMNDESKLQFLNKVLNSDKEYFLQFCNSDLEDFADNVFQEKMENEERKKQKDMYGLLDEADHKNRILLYRGVIIRLNELPSKERLDIYEHLFNINLAEFREMDKMERREYFYTTFIKFLKTLPKKNLTTFIDDIFDRKTPAHEIFSKV